MKFSSHLRECLEYVPDGPPDLILWVSHLVDEVGDEGHGLDLVHLVRGLGQEREGLQQEGQTAQEDGGVGLEESGKFPG